MARKEFENDDGHSMMTVEDGRITCIDGNGLYCNRLERMKRVLDELGVGLDEIEYVNLGYSNEGSLSVEELIIGMDAMDKEDISERMTLVGKDFVIVYSYYGVEVRFEDGSRYAGIEWRDRLCREDDLKKPDRSENAVEYDEDYRYSSFAPPRRYSFEELESILREVVEEMDGDDERVPNWIGTFEHPDILEPVYLVDRGNRTLYYYLQCRFDCCVHVIDIHDMMGYFPLLVRGIHCRSCSSPFSSYFDRGMDSLADVLNIHGSLSTRFAGDDAKDILERHGVEGIWASVHDYDTHSQNGGLRANDIPLYVVAKDYSRLQRIEDDLSGLLGFNATVLSVTDCPLLQGCVPLYGGGYFFGRDEMERIEEQARDQSYIYSAEELVPELESFLIDRGVIEAYIEPPEDGRQKPLVKLFYMPWEGMGRIGSFESEVSRHFRDQVYAYSVTENDRDSVCGCIRLNLERAEEDERYDD